MPPYSHKYDQEEATSILTPGVKILDKRIGRLRKEIDKIYKKLAKTPQSTNKDGSVRRNSRRPRLQEKIERKEQELKDLRGNYAPLSA